MTVKCVSYLSSLSFVSNLSRGGLFVIIARCTTVIATVKWRRGNATGLKTKQYKKIALHMLGVMVCILYSRTTLHSWFDRYIGSVRGKGFRLAVESKSCGKAIG